MRCGRFSGQCAGGCGRQTIWRGRPAAPCPSRVGFEPFQEFAAEFPGYALAPQAKRDLAPADRSLLAMSESVFSYFKGLRWNSRAMRGSGGRGWARATRRRGRRRSGSSPSRFSAFPVAYGGIRGPRPRACATSEFAAKAEATECRVHFEPFQRVAAEFAGHARARSATASEIRCGPEPPRLAKPKIGFQPFQELMAGELQACRAPDGGARGRDACFEFEPVSSLFNAVRRNSRAARDSRASRRRLAPVQGSPRRGAFRSVLQFAPQRGLQGEVGDRRLSRGAPAERLKRWIQRTAPSRGKGRCLQDSTDCNFSE